MAKKPKKKEGINQGKLLKKAQRTRSNLQHVATATDINTLSFLMFQATAFGVERVRPADSYSLRRPL